MGFLTSAQIIILRDKRRILDDALNELRDLCREFSDDNLHSQACEVGGVRYGGCSSHSGESPCPCGAEDPPPPSIDEAYRSLGIQRRTLAVIEIQPAPIKGSMWPGTDSLVNAVDKGSRVTFVPKCEQCPADVAWKCPHAATCVIGGRDPFQ